MDTPSRKQPAHSNTFTGQPQPLDTPPSPSPSQSQPPSQLSAFLSLPLELRLQVYKHLFSDSATLTLRSLFIRTNYRNVFMTQQPRLLHPAILAANRQIQTEARPVLYGGPRWLCGCRVESLATQIGTANFGVIRRMGIDVDDLDLVVECARRERQKRVHRGSGYAMQEIVVKVPPGLLRGDGGGSSSSGSSGGNGGIMRSLGSKVLDFSCLEDLEMEGYQSAAMSSRGTHRVRVEALRLCELASQLVDFHPNLKVLLQRGGCWDGGADARDLTLGRVRWRFVKDVPVHLLPGRDEGSGFHGVGSAGDEEHIVDLVLIRSMLELMLREDERAAQSETSLPVAWTSSGTGRFNLYPYLQVTQV